MRSLIENASIYRKLLIVPALAIVALALVCTAALQGFGTERDAGFRLKSIAENRAIPALQARMLASGLQADMFRFIALSPMGTPRAHTLAIGGEIAQRNAALDEAMALLAAHSDDAASARRLIDLLARYRAESATATARFLDNPAQGAGAARDAALALDDVVAAAAGEDRAAAAQLHAAEQEAAELNMRHAVQMLAVLGVGSPLMILVSLLVARCVAGPVRGLTAAMARLADGHYDAAMPAVAQRDEIGSMARAVEVFRGGMIRADALARRQQATQTFLDTVIEHLPVPILVKRASDLVYLHVNRAAESFIGVPRQHMLGRTLVEVSPALGDAVRARDLEALAAGGMLVDEGVLVATRSNGQRLATVTRLAIAGEGGAPQYLLTMFDDVTERRRAETRVAYMAHHDALTDLPNRTLFADRLAEALLTARLDGTQVAVLGLDLDHFKEVNDTQGHTAGDKLLRAVAHRLRTCLRDGDTLARLGGDEFAVVLRGVRLSEAEALGGRLIGAVREPFDLDGQQASIGLSIGLALSQPSLDAAVLLKQADMALYEAKAAGRGCLRCFVPEMDARVQQRRALEADLRAAVGTGQLSVHYQPQVDLHSFAVLGAEALMRWHRPGAGNVGPSAFIPVAEDIGLIGPLGVWLLGVACAEAAQWPAHMHVAVNVSPAQLRLPGFPQAVRDALAASGLDPARLELEVTEGILLEDNAETLAGFAELRALGVRLALDDFGTGFASLAYLQKFRFDKIKIDRSFVQGLSSDPSASAIVRAVVGLSRSLGMRTNAEGVESDEEIELLRAHGCMEGQGYRFWRPLTADAMRTLVTAPERATPELAY